ncbi:hypothetical protein Acid345_3959 [Candidatus Koribacter versatilis Ellin345]|uniref:VWFA domain-containing protein n=1 Tax=Koribacter versatilis (strain Ellin345) TaxID=204669 RepID=Q1IJJ1_KORVE|nr:hypothetical protein [Candidatus Koribacter versatilis]ABF42959.1 hypothetical protein Acid345_3959 [Candidatus Koribacter versatilis Ellin345]
MKNLKGLFAVLCAFYVLTFAVPFGISQEKAASATVQVHVVITDAALREDAELPPLQKQDIKVKQGKSFLPVSQVIPAQGENAALQLMILIDDTLNPSVGNNLQDLKDFISAQPSSTVIGVAYMSNATINVAQNFTPDHDLALKAVRLPRGAFSTMDSPYLSLISLLKGWQQEKVRREVLMVTDGIDRLRGETPQPSRVGPTSQSGPNSQSRPKSSTATNSPAGLNSRLGPDFGTVYHSMPAISVDATSASEMSQRFNVVVYSIYAAGVGRAGRSGWDLQLGLSGLTKIADETGGECYSLGTSPLVSFKPHLERLQKLLSNQYYVLFDAVPRKKAGFQRVNIQTELPNSEILAPDNVWVRAAE